MMQSNFHDYDSVRMSNGPAIDTYIINSGEVMGGAGKPGTPPIAPAMMLFLMRPASLFVSCQYRMLCLMPIV